jgi:hypothetical protein
MDDMTIRLSGDETSLLAHVLRDRMGSLRQQVYHAETASFKDELKAEQRLLQGLLSKLPS